MSTINNHVSNHDYNAFKQELRKRRAEKNRIELYRITILSWLVFVAAVLIIYFLLIS